VILQTPNSALDLRSGTPARLRLGCRPRCQIRSRPATLPGLLGHHTELGRGPQGILLGPSGRLLDEGAAGRPGAGGGGCHLLALFASLAATAWVAVRRVRRGKPAGGRANFFSSKNFTNDDSFWDKYHNHLELGLRRGRGSRQFPPDQDHLRRAQIKC